LDEVGVVRDLAFESFQVRSEARESLEGALEELRSSLAAQLEEAEKSIVPLIRQLIEPDAADVKKIAGKMLDHVLAELDGLSYLKDANSNMFIDLQENLENLQTGEEAFTNTVLRAASANPQNASLQKICIDALTSKDITVDLDECITCLLRCLEVHPLNRSLQEACCEAIPRLAIKFPDAVGHIGPEDGVSRLLKVMTDNIEQKATQEAALSALLVLLKHNAGDKLQAVWTLSAVGVIQALMQKHPEQQEIQRIGRDLLSILAPLS